MTAFWSPVLYVKDAATIRISPLAVASDVSANISQARRKGFLMSAGPLTDQLDKGIDSLQGPWDPPKA